MRAALRGCRSPKLNQPRSLSASASPPGFLELRQYDLEPAGAKQFLKQTHLYAPLRQALFPGWLGFWTTELGGNLNRVHHLYHFTDYAHRDECWAQAAGSMEWMEYQQHMSSLVCSQQSTSFLEAESVLHGAGLEGFRSWSPPSTCNDKPSPAAYEMRRYQLKLGYDTVPDFMRLFNEGLPDKLLVDDSGASSLVTLMYSDCGPLNTVIELWRHESLQRSQDSRAASRASTKWRSTIGSVAELAVSFETQFLRPTAFSPWR
jgi:hypothetical protein